MLLIGLGTGRCGTMTLSRLLSMQHDCKVTHEDYHLPWCEDMLEFEKSYSKITNHQTEFFGDVAFYHLPYVESIINKTKDVKFIILKRPKEEVISSYIKKTAGTDHWRPSQGVRNSWDRCYPNFLETKTKQEAIGLYYDLYYQLTDEIPPEICYRINTEDLNNKEECEKMLRFCGFNEPKFKEIKANAWPQKSNKNLRKKHL